MMYKGFNLELKEGDLESIIPIDFDNNKSKIKRSAVGYLKANNNIFANEIGADWFPEIKSDIFISHSHRDEELAKQLASWIKKNLDLTCFIDSSVWGNFTDIACEINNKFSRSDDGNLDYDKVLHTSSHVNCLLSSALTKMIDTCECVIFLNTSNSVNTNGFSSLAGTYSPWLFHEILTSKLIRQKTDRTFSIKDSMALEENQASYTMTYDLDLEHLTDITIDDLNTWKERTKKTFNNHINPLNLLYKLK